MKVTTIKDHPIVKRAASISREYISKCDPKNPDNDPVATKRESYSIETLLSIGNVVSCIDQLHFSVDMLAGYRTATTPEHMNRYDYIVFGIENYYLRLTSVFDRCLRLANVAYQFGLPERQCSTNTIIKNAHIKGTPVAGTLKKLDDFTQPFRFYRNTVAHESAYSEKDLDRMGAYYHLEDEKDDVFFQYRNLFKVKTDKYVSDKKQEFGQHLVELEGYVEAYFNELHKTSEQKLRDCV